MTARYKEYGFASASESHMHRHFMPKVLKFAEPLTPGTRALDVGCGNGFTCGEFLRRDCKVVGIDLSEEGIGMARSTYPGGRFEILAAHRDVLQNLGEPLFDRAMSTEVVEHLYAPRRWARGCFAALTPGGKFICTTPYHGYLKNLMISLAGGWDKHANPLRDGGHIKLWSRQTLSALVEDAGFTKLQFTGAGRLPFFWMTVVVGAEKSL